MAGRVSSRIWRTEHSRKAAVHVIELMSVGTVGQQDLGSPERVRRSLYRWLSAFPAELGSRVHIKPLRSRLGVSVAGPLPPSLSSSPANNQTEDFGRRLCKSSQSRELSETVVNSSLQYLGRGLPR